MRKVVVIGGAGFIGSHTADELSERGFDVIIFDVQEPVWLRKDQRFIKGSTLDLSSVESALDGADFVYHFAGISDIGDAIRRPYEAINVNVMGTTCILEAIQNSTVKRFIYASTMYVYSSYGSFYRASKQAAEILIEAYSENSTLEFTLLRYGSLYGPRAQDWNGLRRYVKQVVEEGKLQYGGSGKERREYIHVKDAARLSVDVLEDWKKNTAITVTGTQVMTSGEIIEMIFEISGKLPNIEYIEGQKNDYHYTMTPYRYTPKKARKLVPSEFVDIGEGILEIVESISDQHEIENKN